MKNKEDGPPPQGFCNNTGSDGQTNFVNPGKRFLKMWLRYMELGFSHRLPWLFEKFYQ
jgi:hypothetical protein